MRTIEYKVHRLVLETEAEKQTAKSWGRDWSVMSKNETVEILVGTWTGYTANQRRVVHRTLNTFGVKDRLTIEYTDNTRLELVVIKVSRNLIIQGEMNKIDGYSSLIRDAVKSGKTYYKV